MNYFGRKTLIFLVLTLMIFGVSGCFWSRTTTDGPPTTTITTVSSTATTVTTTITETTTATQTTVTTTTTATQTTLPSTTTVTTAPTAPLTTITTTPPPTTVITSTTTYTTTVTTIITETTTPTTVTTTATPTTTVPTTVQVSLSVTPPEKIVYVIGEMIDIDDMQIIYTDTYGNQMGVDPRDCLIEMDALDTYGNKEVAVTYMDIKVTFMVTYRLPVYYQTAEDKSGDALKAALNEILNTGLTRKSYWDATWILAESDRDPNNTNNLILVYRGTSVSSAWDSGVTWNREHVWPQSLLGVSVSNSSINVGSDLQNLKPANPSENSSRGNKFFANATTTVSYCPRDEVKGDIARILFYMVVMYESPGLDLELVDTNPSTYQMAMLSVLLQWHVMDPPDDFERNRNEVIFSYQNNRNPFIDYPDFVRLIYG